MLKYILMIWYKLFSFYLHTTLHYITLRNIGRLKNSHSQSTERAGWPSLPWWWREGESVWRPVKTTCGSISPHQHRYTQLGPRTRPVSPPPPPPPSPRHSALPVVRLKFPSSTCPDLTIFSRLVKFAFLGRKSSSFQEKVEYFRNAENVPCCEVKSWRNKGHFFLQKFSTSLAPA